MRLFTSSRRASDSDEELINRYRRTDDIAVLGELYQRHSEMVYYVCLGYFKEHEDSQDAVMQLFEELVEKVKSHEIRNFEKWLYVVAKNHCLMALRSQKNKKGISFDEFVEFAPSVHPFENEGEKESRLQVLERCVEQLPERQKQTVQLFFLREKCYKEIAEETGFSLKDVKSYIQNGKRNLKICVERSEED